MLDPANLERAVELHERSYRLLRWMTDAIERGFIAFDAAHTYATLPAATLAWVERHHADLPPAARPERDDLRAFCNLFATYLESSFDLVRDPGERKYSKDAHCFCPMCSWLVPMPRLKTKQLTRADKKRADKLQHDVLRGLAAERSLPEPPVDLADDPALREPLALAAYGRDLVRRLDGVAEGPAALVLWRRFAWKPEGSPKPDFKLTATAIVEAEQLVAARIAK